MLVEIVISEQIDIKNVYLTCHIGRLTHHSMIVLYQVQLAQGLWLRN